MIETLFNAIVDALQAICARTGLHYSEINILIYCGLIPWSWSFIVYWRRRRGGWLPMLHLLLSAIYYLQKQRWHGASKKFYDANIHVLEQLSKMTGWNYVDISIVIGVVVPMGIYLLLYTLPKPWLLSFYAILVLGNLAWFAWVLQY